MNNLSDVYAAGDSLAGVQAGIDSCLARALDRRRLSLSAPDVSAWSVQEHLEHLLFSDRRVLGWVSDVLALPNPETRAQSPRELGVALLARGSIPRGRGPAPDFTLPTGLEQGRLVEGLERLRDLAEGLVSRAVEIDACLHTHPHHVLGHFTPAEWLRFLHLHHRHHEAIMSDVLAA
ncbi:DinB family protein [Candidatus Palauibacter sp.]|uniref:DinB family protein n=1 Tax=Candidatus Palauibacter sp. TaxID=3101350 RepID=UPI003AF1F395